MSQSQSSAYIIEIHDRAAGIITRDDRGFRFFSSERLFDSLEGRQFRSAREAERAARAVFAERGGRANSQLFAN
ncbi:hypothetical protein [Bradyrhizobium cosmicum]|jgi:hypothetical protein|uniref:Uncharacterized protein n=1 Tax=Bradyrhizobium cosmicum TaxID=1404864 RepID=A0AAI8MKX5_9BRAD|nr:hypothetical protein [Bradyrhizobium cosmicum]QDP23566.1 hypothetical protein FNV92_15955 [Bradyrhizobium cosmicum]BAL79743.1 hypothetical protein S23_65640 [Bradyrhizobium cosmicum]